MGNPRAWAALVLAVVVLGASAFGVVAWRAHRSLAGDPDAVLRGIADSLGRPVEADDVQVTWWPPGLVVRGVRIPDESPLGPGNMVHADEVRLVVRAWPLLFGEVVVKRVEAAVPVVRLVRGVDGGWNFAFRGDVGRDDVGPDFFSVGSEREGEAGATIGRPEFDLVEVAVTRGRLSLRDRAVPGVPEFEVTALDAVLRRRPDGTRVDFRGEALGGPRENLTGSWTLSAEDAESLLEVSAGAVPAGRLPEVLQLARGSVPFGVVLDGIVSTELTARAPARWPPSKAELRVTVDAREASATAAGGYLGKGAGVPLSVELHLEAHPERLEVRRAAFVSGDAIVQVVAEEGASGAVQGQPPLVVSSENVTAATLAEWVPVLEALAPQGALNVAGTFFPSDGEVDGRLRLTGEDLAIRIGAEPADLGAAAVAVELGSNGAFTVGLSVDGFRGGELGADRVLASIAGDESGGYQVRIDGEGGGRADARVDRLALECDVRGQRADVRRFEVLGLGGRLEAEGEIERDPDDVVSARFAPQWDGVDFGGLLRLFGVEVEVEGLFTGEAALSAKRTAEETFLQTLTGVFGARLEQARVPDFNLARSTVGHLGKIPGLGGTLEGRAREAAPELLVNTSDIDAVTIDGAVSDERVSLSSVRLQAPAYALDASGTVGFDGGVELAGDLVLDEEASDALVEVSALLEILAPDGERIRIPIEIQGQYPDLVSAPSPAFVGETLSGVVPEEAVGGAEGLLRRFLGERGRDATTE